MKRIVSIFLVFLLLLNALGFYGLLQGLRFKTTRDLVQRLDNDQYSDDETVTIKVPFTIPYQLDADEYERVDGEIQFEGEVYRLVKQKLESDTLFIVCIKDRHGKRINQAISDYVKTFTDKPIEAKHSGKILISFIKDFLPSAFKISPASSGWNYSVNTRPYTNYFENRSPVIFTPPPQS